jgi:hypothetical protein
MIAFVYIDVINNSNNSNNNIISFVFIMSYHLLCYVINVVNNSNNGVELSLFMMTVCHQQQAKWSRARAC